jgi:HlyD family secretion protein
MMTRNRQRFLRAAILVVVLGAGVGYFALRRSAGDTDVTFKVAVVDRGVIEQTVTATGQLNAVVTVLVGSQISGIIQSLGADFNDQVKEGQIVAQLEPTRFKANLEQARASLKNAQASQARAVVNLAVAKREYDRARALADQKVIGESELEELKAKYDLAKVEVQAAEAQVAQSRAQVGMAQVDLERTTIRSPISGTVLQRAVDVGQTVAASLSAPTLFTIAQDLSKMEVRAAVDESDVGKLREGMEARFAVDAHPGREFAATIHQIRSNPNVQQNVVTYDAILRVDNPEGRLRPGMTASVRIVTERREDALRVPNVALRFKPPPEIVLAQTQAPPAGVVSGGRSGRGDSGASGESVTMRGRPGDSERGLARHDGVMGRGPGQVARGEAGIPLAEGDGGRRRGGGGQGFRRGGGGDGAGNDMRGGHQRRSAEGGGGRIVTRVYRAEGNKVVAIPFRAGIADEQFTEVLRGPIKEGDQLVVEATGPGIQQAPQRQAAPGGMNRNRGPRFF